MFLGDLFLEEQGLTPVRPCSYGVKTLLLFFLPPHPVKSEDDLRRNLLQIPQKARTFAADFTERH